MASFRLCPGRRIGRLPLRRDGEKRCLDGVPVDPDGRVVSPLQLGQHLVHLVPVVLAIRRPLPFLALSGGHLAEMKTESDPLDVSLFIAPANSSSTEKTSNLGHWDLL